MWAAYSKLCHFRHLTEDRAFLHSTLSRIVILIQLRKEYKHLNQDLQSFEGDVCLCTEGAGTVNLALSQQAEVHVCKPLRV